MRPYNQKENVMDENENVPTDYTELIKEAAVKAVVVAVISIAAGCVKSVLINKLEARQNKTVETDATTE
jgi:hypothetical protein